LVDELTLEVGTTGSPT